MAKNRHQIHAKVPVSRRDYDLLSATGDGDAIAGHVLAAMNRTAAERKRRVFEQPWLDRVADISDDVVMLYFAANTEPAR